MFWLFSEKFHRWYNLKDCPSFSIASVLSSAVLRTTGFPASSEKTLVESLVRDISLNRVFILLAGGALSKSTVDDVASKYSIALEYGATYGNGLSIPIGCPFITLLKLSLLY